MLWFYPNKIANLGYFWLIFYVFFTYLKTTKAQITLNRFVFFFFILKLNNNSNKVKG